MNLLRQMLTGGQQRGIGSLRAQLAQRGLLDSGSLGAGVSDIVSDTQGRLAQGTQATAMGESDDLLDMLRQEKARQFSAEQASLGRTHDFDLARMQQDFQVSQRPRWYEYLLQGLGGAAGTAVGYGLGTRLGR